MSQCRLHQPEVVGSAGAGLQWYNKEIADYLVARGRNVSGTVSATGASNIQLQDTSTLIVFWNGNDFDLNGKLCKGYAPGGNFSTPLTLSTELCKYFPKHIVLVSRNNHLWGYNDGWGVQMQMSINCLLQAGINVVLSDEFYRTLKPFAKDAFHTRFGIEPSALWVDYFKKIAEALTHWFVCPVWKRAAKDYGMLPEMTRAPPPQATVLVAPVVPLGEQPSVE